MTTMTIYEKWENGVLIEKTEIEDTIPQTSEFADKSREVTKKWWEFWK